MRRAIWTACLLACHPTSLSPPVHPPVRSCTTTLSTQLPAGRSAVSVAGQFNDWRADAMRDDDGDGIWEITLQGLPPGTTAYKFLWDDEWETVPSDIATAWSNGVENRALHVDDCADPILRAKHVDVDAETISARLQWWSAATGEPPDVSTLSVRVGELDLQATVDEDGHIDVLSPPLDPGKHSLRVELTDVAGRTASIFVPVWIEQRPFEWSDGVMYQIFVDRFRDAGPSGLAPVPGAHVGASYRGGDLVGAHDALVEGYFDDLGVRSLWLSPVYQNPDTAYGPYSGYHGYWPTEPRQVEDRLGTTERPADRALRALVDAAHHRGTRVILDVVLNHVHEDHPYISQHPEWFDLDGCVCGDPGCDWEEMARTCWFADHLPDLDYRNPALVDAMVDDLIWWIETYDVDGLRIDAAKHMDHVILRTLSIRLRERYADVGGEPIYLIGETFTGAGAQGSIMEYVGPTELHGQYDFPLLWRVRDAVSVGGSLIPLAAEVRLSDVAYGTHVHKMSVFLGNHDLSRLASELQGCDVKTSFWGDCPDLLAEHTPVNTEQRDIIDRMALAWAFVLTQPGPPLIYYGDEVGLAGGDDPDNRRDMPWAELSSAQLLLRGEVQRLAQARTSSRALRRGVRRAIHVSDDLYVYARVIGEDVAIVWLRRDAGSPTQVVIPPDLLPNGTELRDALDGPPETITDGQITIADGRTAYGCAERAERRHGRVRHRLIAVSAPDVSGTTTNSRSA
ncbi:MAG: glycosidase [Kiritimatiellia bacterium]|jgi:glycosidase